MMTAKQMCEEIEKQKLQYVISAIQNNGAVLSLKQFFFYNNKQENTQYKIFLGFKDKLLQLGYKVTESTEKMEYFEAERKSFLFIKYNWKVKKTKEIGVITISACCGEE